MSKVSTGSWRNSTPAVHRQPGVRRDARTTSFDRNTSYLIMVEIYTGGAPPTRCPSGCSHKSFEQPFKKIVSIGSWRDSTPAVHRQPGVRQEFWNFGNPVFSSPIPHRALHHCDLPIILTILMQCPGQASSHWSKLRRRKS